MLWQHIWGTKSVFLFRVLLEWQWNRNRPRAFIGDAGAGRVKSFLGHGLGGDFRLVFLDLCGALSAFQTTAGLLGGVPASSPATPQLFCWSAASLLISYFMGVLLNKR